MALSPAVWHRRFEQQAAWTAAVRGYLLGRAALKPSGRVLDVGCGTGAVTARLNGYANGRVVGLDINLDFLRLARQADPASRYVSGDALRLPFPAATFDAAVCHFFLLWIAQPGQALAEMARVARPGGAVVAFAEPDYGGRIDYPPPLETLGRWQAEALRRQGADPLTGRRLSGMFHAAGLRDVETGLLGGQWRGAPPPEQRQSEWDTLAADLRGNIPQARLDELRGLDEQAWRSGERVLFVPTFYAIGLKR